MLPSVRNGSAAPTCPCFRILSVAAVMTALSGRARGAEGQDDPILLVGDIVAEVENGGGGIQGTAQVTSLGRSSTWPSEAALDLRVMLMGLTVTLTVMVSVLRIAIVDHHHKRIRAKVVGIGQIADSLG